MNDTPPRARRRQVLVDRRMQLSVVLSMCTALFVLTLFYAAGIMLSGFGELGPTSDEARRMGILVTGGFFLLTLPTTLLVGVSVTQRIAGPSRVIEEAIRGFRARDYERRLELRRKDHLASLCSEVVGLGNELRAEAARRAELHDELEGALARGALDEAQRLARSLCAMETGGGADDARAQLPATGA